MSVTAASSTGCPQGWGRGRSVRSDQPRRVERVVRGPRGPITGCRPAQTRSQFGHGIRTLVWVNVLSGGGGSMPSMSAVVEFGSGHEGSGGSSSHSH